jgi:hypothetical protein
MRQIVCGVMSWNDMSGPNSCIVMSWEDMSGVNSLDRYVLGRNV